MMKINWHSLAGVTAALLLGVAVPVTVHADTTAATSMNNTQATVTSTSSEQNDQVAAKSQTADQQVAKPQTDQSQSMTVAVQPAAVQQHPVATQPAAAAYRNYGWSLDHSSNYWYYYENGQTVKNDWRWINDNWYYFNYEGIMAANGPYRANGNVYLFDDSGHYLKNSWYHYDYNNRNAISYSSVPNGYYTYQRNHSWDMWFYADQNGYAVQNGWRWINGAWYYFYDDGRMQDSGTRYEDGIVYHFMSSGHYWKSREW